MVGGDQPGPQRPVIELSFAERIMAVHEALERAGIDHGFGGAVALAYYVLEPRATRDIDINVSVETDQAELVLAALPEGIDAEPGTDPADTIRRTGQVRLWWDGRSGVPVDIFFPQHELHAEVAQDTRPRPFLEGQIPVISATHLTVFKALFNRPRDWVDIEAMLEAGAGDPDEALKWLSLLVGETSDLYVRVADLVRRSRSA